MKGSKNMNYSMIPQKQNLSFANFGASGANKPFETSHLIGQNNPNQPYQAGVNGQIGGKSELVLRKSALPRRPQYKVSGLYDFRNSTGDNLGTGTYRSKSYVPGKSTYKMSTYGDKSMDNHSSILMESMSLHCKQLS